MQGRSAPLTLASIKTFPLAFIIRHPRPPPPTVRRSPSPTDLPQSIAITLAFCSFLDQSRPPVGPQPAEFLLQTATCHDLSPPSAREPTLAICFKVTAPAHASFFPQHLLLFENYTYYYFDPFTSPH